MVFVCKRDFPAPSRYAFTGVTEQSDADEKSYSARDRKL